MRETSTHAETFGIALERALGDRKKKWLAEQLEVSSQLVTNWTQGEREPLPRTAVRIEQVLEVEPTGRRRPTASSGHRSGRQQS